MNDSKTGRTHWFWELLASVVTLGQYESSYEREAREKRERGVEWTVQS
jgi:hypothetical protein